ncbi:unnamed protein product [Ceutorhynchus assimilis]|uniref:Uncharacterized protein n=1 Tax=Ceutorhynchus assimilis TaxID=467358 RepID=A0A9N9MTG0_9CUCU|nr:unnamed protein product [Ceutorhynchus assimilis]
MDFDTLKKNRTAAKSNITRILNSINKLKDTETDITYFETKLEQLQKAFDRYSTVQDEIEHNISELQPTLIDSENRDLVEEQCDKVTQKEADDYKHQVYVLENEHIKFKSIIMTLEKDIIDIKKEILERDSTIEDKEKRIFQLKSKNQELEKFKFILDFKIKELKSQIEPRERTIQEQVTQINEMVRELENLQKVILNLDTQMAEGRAKLAAAVNEVRKEVEKNRVMKKALQAIRMDIHHASGFIQNVPMLQKVVKEMYHKYNADKDFEVSQAEDTEAKSEFLRQRDFLERTVSTLHAQATKSSSTLSFDKVRLVEENAALLVETNQLRKNLQVEINQNKKLNSIIGMSYVTPKLAQKKVNLAISTKEEIHNKYRNTITKNEAAIESLVQENERLLNIIAENVERAEAEADEEGQNSRDCSLMPLLQKKMT